MRDDKGNKARSIAATTWRLFDTGSFSPSFTSAVSLVGSAIVLVGFALLVPGCQRNDCSPCRPGTHASNPNDSCSLCVVSDGGADAVDAVDSDEH